MTITTSDSFEFLCFEDEYKPFEIPFFEEDFERYGDFQFDDQTPYPTETIDIPKNCLEFAKIVQEEEVPEVSQEESVKNTQSDLHNCPKHLIKFIIQSLNFERQDPLICDQFASLSQPVKENMKKLLGIFQLCLKGKIKSFSKQLLKIVFEEGSQHIQKLKLLQNPLIKKVFEGSNICQMNEAKSVFRQFIISKIMKGKTQFVGKSRIVRKTVNQRYLQVFVQQLKNGKVKQRVSKQDKEWILQLKNF